MDEIIDKDSVFHAEQASRTGKAEIIATLSRHAARSCSKLTVWSRRSLDSHHITHPLLPTVMIYLCQ